MDASPLVRFGLVGSGWRGRFFLRLARQAPERFAVTRVVTRTAERGAQVEAEWGVPTVRTVEELLADGPEFVIVSVPWERTAPLTVELVEAGVRVLAETPPAADLAGMRELWAAVGQSGLVQVAEQYLYMPAHAARRALLGEGLLGDVTSVQVSSTHGYHAVSMIRHLLGVGFASATVHARAFTAPLADPLTPQGWTGSVDPKPTATTIATIDFGAGRMGLYDFTGNQWWNPLRARRLVIRGSAGEWVDDRVVRLLTPDTPVESRLVRRLTGLDLNLEGLEVQHVSFDGRAVYRNPFVGAGFSEDDLAVAGLLADVAAWARDDAPPPYPLADGCQDHLISLAIDESARTGVPVTTAPEPWA
jgi:predicted dehydrogenase